MLIQQHRAYSEIDDNEDDERLTIAHKAAEISSLGKSSQADLLKIRRWKAEPEDATGLAQRRNGGDPAGELRGRQVSDNAGGKDGGDLGPNKDRDQEPEARASYHIQCGAN